MVKIKNQESKMIKVHLKLRRHTPLSLQIHVKTSSEFMHAQLHTKCRMVDVYTLKGDLYMYAMH